MAVTAIARRGDRLEALAADGITGVCADATDADALDGAVKAAVAARGKLTALIYCAGLQKIKPLRTMSPADLHAVVGTNLVGALLAGRLFSSRLLTDEQAVFCAVSSIAAHRPEPGIVAYAAAKAGLEAVIRGLAREAAPRRSVGVAPGWLDTEMTRGYSQIYNDTFRQQLEKASPAGIATVDSVVDAVAFLISPAARHITGVIVTVDGGASL